MITKFTTLLRNGTEIAQLEGDTVELFGKVTIQELTSICEHLGIFQASPYSLVWSNTDDKTLMMFKNGVRVPGVLPKETYRDLLRGRTPNNELEWHFAKAISTGARCPEEAYYGL